MSETLKNLIQESDSMNAKGAMDAVGIDRDALERLVDVVENHELGATPRAVLIYVRGMLQRTGQKFDEVSDDLDVMKEWRAGLPASSSISRAIPLAAVIEEHLPADNLRTIFDLGAGRAHASQVFLRPEILGHEFFQKYRVSWDPNRMPDISKVIAVDSRQPSWDEAAQVYYRPDGSKTDKVEAMEELESMGDHNGRLVTVQRDIRNLTSEDLSQYVGNEEAEPVIFLNNVLYAVSDEVRKEVEEAVNSLAEELGAPILQMESWKLFDDKKPEITLPGSERPIGLPAYIRMGTNLDAMRIIAKLDGNTGKPFILVKEDGTEVFVDKTGETGGGSYFQFLFGVELKKRHYLKQLEGRKHMVEEIYLVERDNVKEKEYTCV